MIMTIIRPETEMKESGASWMGKVPCRWSISKLKWYLRRTDPRNPGSKQVLSLYREYGVIPKDSRDDNHNATSEDTSKYKYVRVGDFVVNKMKAWQGSVAVSEYEGIVSPAYYVYHFTDDSYHKRYFHYLLRSCYKEEFMRLSGGIRVGQWDLSSNDLDNILVVIPKKDEQQAIANYLDKTCSKIDEIIAEAKASIDEYKELKQSAIDNATMIGIYNSEMKDTDYVWFPKMPKHWNLAPASLLFRENVRPVNENDVSLSLSQVDGLIPTDDMSERSLKSATHDNWKHVIPDDLVLNRFKGHLGVFFASRYTGMVSFHYGVYHAIRDDVYAKYYEYLFHSTTYKNIFALKSNGITVGLQNLSNSNFYSVKILHPSLDEQKEIVDYLDGKCKQIDSIVTEKESLINDLEAYKKSLIYEVVTGKRRVV